MPARMSSDVLFIREHQKKTFLAIGQSSCIIITLFYPLILLKPHHNF